MMRRLWSRGIVVYEVSRGGGYDGFLFLGILEMLFVY
jgi:hypothetical protein